MGGAGTADAIEGDDVIDPEPAGNARVSARDAYRQCSPGDPKCSPTKFEHFRHERQMVRCSLSVQRLHYFVRRLHFHKIAAAKSRASLAHVIRLKIAFELDQG